MPEKPAAPKGCGYGPWWDEDTECWVCLERFKDQLLISHWNGRIWSPSCDHSRAHAELLRLAAQRDRLLDELQKVRDLQPEGSYVGCKLQALIAETRGEG